MRWLRRCGPFLCGCLVTAMAVLSGSHGWAILLVGAATGLTWAIARTVGELDR